MIKKKIQINNACIYIFIIIILDESGFLDALHFLMKNIHDLETIFVGGAMSKPVSDIVCLLLLV